MDILSEKEAPAAKKWKTEKRYAVCVGEYGRMHTKRFYTRKKAEKIAKRARKMGLDAYVSSPMLCRMAVA